MMRIELCAPLGTGKTAVAQALAQHWGWTLVREPDEGHPFLADFYAEPAKYGFESAAFFALAHIHAIKKHENENAVFDAGHILHQCYWALAKKDGHETRAMEKLYALAETLPKPDLIIELCYPVDKTLERVRARNRDIEKDVGADYIEGLQREIKTRLGGQSQVPVLVVDMERFDVVKRPHDIAEIARLVDEKLNPARRLAPAAGQHAPGRA